MRNSILTEGEKKYLGAVIYPYHGLVQGIKKRMTQEPIPKILGMVIYAGPYTFIHPLYDDSLFQGMEPERKYTPTDLGL